MLYKDNILDRLETIHIWNINNYFNKEKQVLNGFIGKLSKFTMDLMVIMNPVGENYSYKTFSCVKNNIENASSWLAPL